ncbi:MAG TPA: hypothetical protein VGO33_10025 [Gemmatimonadaceae bacterium]|nr:hypothetical protein [Gemmatimonadaceae bacterium]
MPAQGFKIYPKRQLVSIQWKFAPTTRDWYDVTGRILDSPDYEPGMRMIAYRGGTLAPVTSDHVRQVLAVLERRSARMEPVILAIVAPGLCDFGMARMMESLSETASVVVRAFRRPREAIEWLKDPVRYEYYSHLAVA